mgnify:CR=1 FL=1
MSLLARGVRLAAHASRSPCLLAQVKPKTLGGAQSSVGTPVLDHRIRFNTIDVIESIPDDEQRTGLDLFENVIAPLSARSSPRILVRFHEVETTADLLVALADVRHRAEQFNHHPILHIEAHGSPHGLGLRSGSIAWLDLLEELTAINAATRLNLLVAMSSCWGADISKLVHPAHPAPFWGAIGPHTSIDAGPLYDSFCAYYRSLLTDFDGAKALDAMRSASLPQSERMAFRPAEIFFRLIFFRFIAEYSSGERLQARISRLMGFIIEADPSALDNRAEVEAWLAARILEHEVHFERYKATFFMYDRYPENRERFKPLLADGPPWPVVDQVTAHAASDASTT